MMGEVISLPVQEGGKARITSRRQRLGLSEHAHQGRADDLTMDHADPDVPCAICGQTGDCA